MPLEIRERNRNIDGSPLVEIVDTSAKQLQYDITSGQWLEMPVEASLHCFTPTQAEDLAPKLMEWAIKRKMKR